MTTTKHKKSNAVIFKQFFVVFLLCNALCSAIDTVYSETYTSDTLLYPSWSNETSYPRMTTISQAKSYVLLESINNQVLLRKKPKQQRSIASLTKLMTALIIIENAAEKGFSLNSHYRVTPDVYAHSVASLPFDASRMGLAVGDAPTGDELLRALLVVSANDAALYLAYILSGSVTEFVALMNKKAQELFLHSTYYEDPTGLSANNVSTAEDLALLSQYIMQHTEFDIFSYTSQSSFFWHYHQKSTNILLDTYKYIDGLKTGYIDASGFNIIVSALRNDRRVLVVVLGVEAESIAKGVRLRSDEALSFIDFAYNNFSLVEFSVLKEVLPLWGAQQNSIEIISVATVMTIPFYWFQKLKKTTQYIEETIFAPIKQGTVLASVAYSVDTRTKVVPIVEQKLYASVSVKKANIFKRLWHRVVLLFK